MPIKRLLASILVAVIAAVALYAGVFFAQKHFSASSTGESVLEFSLNDLDGNRRDSNEWSGKVILLNFWATWCSPCREEMPMLADFQDRYRDRGLQVIGIAIDDPEPVRTFADSMDITYPLLIADDTTPALMHAWNDVGAIPFSLVTDRGGVVRESKLGVFTHDELTAMIEPLLDQGRP